MNSDLITIRLTAEQAYGLRSLTDYLLRQKYPFTFISQAIYTPVLPDGIVEVTCRCDALLLSLGAAYGYARQHENPILFRNALRLVNSIGTLFPDFLPYR